MTTFDWTAIEQVKLRRGMGSGSAGDRCALQEYRARVGLDPKKDACPPDVCPLLHRLTLRINDGAAEWRARLPTLLPRLQESRGSWTLLVRRALRAALATGATTPVTDSSKAGDAAFVSFVVADAVRRAADAAKIDPVALLIELLDMHEETTP